MKFESPAALWALASLLLLILFSLWRQAAARTVVPSLLLWKKIPERNPPIRALRRPKWRIELFLQALAIAAAVLALAQPFFTSSRAKPRKIAFVFDTSARMKAGGRLEKAKAEAERLRAEKLAGDVVSVFAAVPSPRRLESIDEARAIDAHVDLEPLLAAAHQEAEEVIVFTDRPVAGAHSVLFGSEASNVGIVDFTATDLEVFVRIANHGQARRAPIRLRWDAQMLEETIDLPPGERTWFRKGDFRKAREVRVELEVADSLPVDNAVGAVRLGRTEVEVALRGTPMPLLERALGAVSGTVVRQDARDARIGVGVDEPPPPAPFSVWLHSPEGRFRPEGWTITPHPLTAGLREAELGKGGVGELPPEARRGTTLLEADGKKIGVLDGEVFHLSIDLGPRGWASTPSFPIFWKNVVDFARGAGGSFTVVRTGRPLPMPGEVSRAPGGSFWSLSPSGQFLAWTCGEYAIRGAQGEVRLEANLLDARETDLQGVTRALDWDPGAPAGREYARRGLAGWAAAFSLILVVLGWILQRRSD